jgi:hypothetical protein
MMQAIACSENPNFVWRGEKKKLKKRVGENRFELTNVIQYAAAVSVITLPFEDSTNLTERALFPLLNGPVLHPDS